MRKLFAFATFALLLVLLTSTSIQAHPGRTDSNGCHTCRTNCEKWGLAYGEYHCHNGGGTSSSGGTSAPSTSGSSTPSPSTPQPVQEAKPKVEVPAQPKIDYAKEGAADGYSFKMKNPDKTLEDVTYTYSQKAYKTAFNKSYEKAETELMNNSSSLAETNGKKDALEKEAYQLKELPSKIIKNEYIEYYKTAFDDAEQEVKTVLQGTAEYNAYEYVYNDKKISDVEDYNLKKFKAIYKEAYDTSVKSYEKEKKQLLQLAKDNGKKDGEEGEDQNLDFLDAVKDTAFYPAAKEAYEEAYEENKKEGSLLIGMAATAVLILGVYLFIKKLRNRKKA